MTTNLTAGSIAFTGFNADTNDNLAFVVLQDIAAGTVINFTDNNWSGTAFATDESIWSWTAGSDIAAGTVVTLDSLKNGAAATSNEGTIAYSGTATPDITTTKEAVYAYVGDASAPTFLTAITESNNFSLAVGGVLTNTGLLQGQTAVAMVTGVNIGAYNGPTTVPDTADLLTLINNPANWAIQGTSGDSHDGTAPDAPFPTTPFVVDPSLPVVSFAPDSVTVSHNEGNNGETTTYTFTVQRTNGTTGEVDFSGTVTANFGTDAADFGGTLPETFSGSIADGAATGTVTITVAGDNTHEDDETFGLKLTSATNGGTPVFVGGQTTATGTIVNDDPAQTISFAESGQTISHVEGDTGTSTTYTFTVVRDGTSGDLTFTGSFGTGSGTINKTDFGGTLPPNSFTGVIPDGQTSATLSITVSGDSTVEADDVFVMSLSSGTNDNGVSVVVAGLSARGKIVNDDFTIHNGETVSDALTFSGTDQYVIEHGGTLNSGSTFGAVVYGQWTGAGSDVLLDNHGIINGVAVQIGDNASGTLTIHNEVDGQILGNGNDGALGSLIDGSFGASVSATVVIDNDGQIDAAGAGKKSPPEAGIALNLTRGNGKWVVNNSSTGVITSDSPNGVGHTAIEALSGNATINNAGQIIGNDAGIVAGKGTIVHNEDGGLIEGTFKHAVTGSTGITVINDAGGTMIGGNGSAVNMDTDSTVANTTYVTNHGDMEGRTISTSNDSDGDAVDVDGLLVVKNYGMIQGLGANGTHDGGANVSEGIAAGGGEIDNYAGATIYGYGRAIQIDNSSNAADFIPTTIYNEGTIQGDGHGPTNFDPGSDAGIVLENREAIDIVGTFADTITNKGKIIGGVFTDGGDDTFNAYAGSTVTDPIDGGDGTDTLNLLGSGTGTLGATLNFEKLDVQGGIWIAADGSTYHDVHIAGGATMTSTVEVADQGSLTVDLGGSLVVPGNAVISGGAITIDNSGTIGGLGTDTARAIQVNGGTIDNTAGGLILSQDVAIQSSDSTGGNATAAVTITNEGLINALGGQAINLIGLQDDTLTNKASITGSVSMGGGDDTLNVYTTSSISGAIDLGDGSDTVHLLGTGTGALGTIANAETLDVDGGTWTVADTENYDAITIAAGATLANSVAVDGTTTVTVGGTLSSPDDRGITADDGLADGSTLTVDVLAGGKILAGDDAIRVKGDFDNGVVTIDNAGLIQATGGQAIDLTDVASTSTAISITNEATGSIVAIDADAVRGGGNTTIDNFGQIVSQSTGDDLNDGIDFQDDGGGTVTNHTGGSIIGAHHAITGSQAITVVNDVGGTIIGSSGSAVNIDNDNTVADMVTVTNHGTMLGNANPDQDDSDGDAVDVDGLLTVDNYGQIRGTGANGAHDGGANISEGIAAGGGTINNYAGATIYGYGRAIQIDDSANGPAAADTTIHNDGTIEGGGNGPVDVTDEESAGIVLGGREAIDIIGTRDDTITNTSTGQIIGGIFTDGGADALTNTGTITGQVDMGDGNDTVSLDSGSSITGTIFLGAGDDTLTSGASTTAETVNAGIGDDTVTGGAGNDTLTGGTGNDTLTGGGGSDVYNYASGDGDDTIVEGAGQVGDSDQLVLSDINADQATLSKQGNDLEVTLQNGDTILVKDQFADGGIETITFGDGSSIDRDTIAAEFDSNHAPVVGDVTLPTVNEDAPSIFVSFDDLLQNASDADGDSMLINAVSNFTGGTATLVDGGVQFTLDPNYNGAASFSYTVDDGNGGTATATAAFTVTPVNDAPVAVNDAQTVGENGTGTFDLAHNDTDVDGDTLSLTNFIVTDVSGIALTKEQVADAFSIVGGQLHYDGGDLFDSLNDGQNATVTVDYTVADGHGGQTHGEFDLTVTGQTDVVTGTDGSDILVGGNGDDTISAGDGNDLVYSGNGNDSVDGGSGSDFVFSGSGNKTVDGGEGNDYLFGNSGSSAINGGDGNDIIIGGSGSQTINGDAGNDLLFAGTGTTTLAGGTGNDQLYGGVGADTFVFKAGDDHDTAWNFTAGDGASHDVIQLDTSAFADYTALLQSGDFTDTASGAQIAYADGSTLVIEGVHKDQLTINDFHFA